MSQTSDTRRLLLAGLLLAVLPFLLFWQVWWPDARYRRAFAYGDFVEQHYPMRSFVAYELQHGHLPLWDPYTFSGEPAVAESLFAAFYPLGWWQALFPGRLPFMALELEAIAHLSLAGIFTLLLVRRLTGHTGAGLIAGIAFSLGGFLTSYPMLQLIVLEAAIWLPAALWLLERALAQRSLWGIVPAGLVLGIGLLAGYPQLFLYIAYLIASYLLFRAWRLRLSWRFMLPAGLILGAVALGLSAAQWLPSVEMARLSPRTTLSYEILSNGFALRELWGLVQPNPGQWSPLYVGLIPLGLALAGLAFRRRGEVWYWAGVIVVALLLSLGRNGFLYPLAYRLLPGFAIFRQQERIAFLVSLALAILAGYGYAALAGKRRWPRYLGVLILALVTADLFHANMGIILQTPPPGGYSARTPLVQHLQAASDGLGRVSSEGLLPTDGNAGLVFRVRDTVGNGPLYLAAYERFITQVPELRWWQMLNVQYVLTRRHLEHGALWPVLEGDDWRLYQTHLDGRPAWICHAVNLAPNVDSAIRLTAGPDLNPMETAILERPPDPSPAPAAGPESARVSLFSPRRVVVDATLSAPGVLVLSEIAYPGWRVQVNDQEAGALRAFGLLRAVALPAGNWRVEWHYEPLTVYVGVALSLLTLLSCALGLALRTWRAGLKCPLRWGSASCGRSS